MITTYEMAYVEVLAVLKNFLSELEFNKIPKEKIDFFEKYKDKNYLFEINKDLPIEKQNISKKANAILIMLYRDYFANEHQKKILNLALRFNDIRKKYEIEENSKNLNCLFKKRNINEDTDSSQKQRMEVIKVKKEEWYKRLFSIFKK